MVSNLPAVQDTQVRSLGQDDPLEKGMATHSSVLAWRIPWTEEPGRLQSMGSRRARRDRVMKHTEAQLLLPLAACLTQAKLTGQRKGKSLSI